jgi:hypothetical protein
VLTITRSSLLRPLNGLLRYDGLEMLVMETMLPLGL